MPTILTLNKSETFHILMELLMAKITMQPLKESEAIYKQKTIRFRSAEKNPFLKPVNLIHILRH